MIGPFWAHNMQKVSPKVLWGIFSALTSCQTHLFSLFLGGTSLESTSLAAVTSRVSYRKPCSSLSSEIHPGLVLQPAGMLTFPSVSNLLLLFIFGLLMNGKRLIPEHAGVSPSFDVFALVHGITAIFFASSSSQHVPPWT